MDGIKMLQKYGNKTSLTFYYYGEGYAYDNVFNMFFKGKRESTRRCRSVIPPSPDYD